MVNIMIDMAENASGEALHHASREALGVGTRVDVRSRYVGAWSHGFEVAGIVPDGYLIRRLSDGSVLPDIFSVDDVRAEHRKQGLWWY